MHTRVPFLFGRNVTAKNFRHVQRSPVLLPVNRHEAILVTSQVAVLRVRLDVSLDVDIYLQGE